MTELPPIMRKLELVQTAHAIFKEVLGHRSPDAVFEQGLVTISQDWKRIYGPTSGEGGLAEAVFDVDFPKISSPAELEHYTDLDSLKGMLATGSIRLQPVTRNLDSGEFRTYAEDHDLHGYLDPPPQAQPLFEELARDLFYVSLTRPGHTNEAGMWDSFGARGKGVRLRLRVATVAGTDLRQVGYQLGAPTALKRINDELMRRTGLVFSAWGTSRICAFYLLERFAVEEEVRLMIKRHQGGIDRTQAIAGARFWPVDLIIDGGASSDPCCRVELVGITPGDRCDPATVRRILEGTPYADVLVG